MQASLNSYLVRLYASEPITAIYSTSKKMKLKLFAIAILLTATVFPSETFGAFCTYNRNSDYVLCGSVYCDTQSPSSPNDKLPAGDYYVGNFYHHGSTPWFNLYPRKKGTNDYWDYHTKVPELGCRGGFALHSGTISEGCITVSDDGCFNNLKMQITYYFPVIDFTVKECRGCSTYWSSCWWTSDITRPCTADLKSV